MQNSIFCARGLFPTGTTFHEALVDLEFRDDFMELAYGLIMAGKMKAVAALTGETE